MKKLLPKTVNNPKGFTLIELLVVVAIIAILVIIAISLFAGVQKRARDSRRQAEIDAMAKSMEVFKDPTTQAYVYTADSYNKDYPVAKPTDPKYASGSGPSYCIRLSGTATPPTPITSAEAASWLSGCPSFWTQIPGGTQPATQAIIPASPATYSWTICARLEAPDPAQAFCKSSLSN